MTFKLHLLPRAIGLGLTATLLIAAGQLPVAAIAVGPVIAAPEIAAPAVVAPAIVAVETSDDTVTAPRPAQLATLVAHTVDAAPTAYGDRECLARAVYFEARGEPLEGQLAVAQVILNRVASGRFADTVCGVIAQRGQFSFDRSRAPADSRDWRVAKAIAAIAANADWEPMAPRAVSFHATRVSASWTNMKRVSTIGNHVFYR